MSRLKKVSNKTRTARLGERVMTTIQDYIIATIRGVPAKRIEGRKRLQKLLHLLQCSGASVPAEFELHHFGPFSFELANVAQESVFGGIISEKFESTAMFSQLQSIYELGPNASSARLNANEARLIKDLSEFSTVELEVASTVAYFHRSGSTKLDAIEQTKFIKPTKSTPKVLSRANQILKLVGI